MSTSAWHAQGSCAAQLQTNEKAQLVSEDNCFGACQWSYNLVMKRRAARAAILFSIAIVSCHAQPSTGTLSGRVLTIAKGGDIKPARLAHVFLASGDDQVTLQQSVDRALAKRLDDIKNGTDPQEACVIASMSIHEAVKSGSNIQTVDTDEDGSFDLHKLTAGTYAIVVIGAANGYQSVWYSTTTVTAGKRQKVKMSEPVLACE